jgi:hypothetical protein
MNNIIKAILTTKPILINSVFIKNLADKHFFNPQEVANTLKFLILEGFINPAKGYSFQYGDNGAMVSLKGLKLLEAYQNNPDFKITDFQE